MPLESVLNIAIWICISFALYYFLQLTVHHLASDKHLYQYKNGHWAGMYYCDDCERILSGGGIVIGYGVRLCKFCSEPVTGVVARYTGGIQHSFITWWPGQWEIKEIEGEFDGI